MYWWLHLNATDVSCPTSTGSPPSSSVPNMIRSLVSVARSALDRSVLPSSSLSPRVFVRPPSSAPQLCWVGVDCGHLDPAALSSPSSSADAADKSETGVGGLFNALWLAVPKSRKTKGKKRMKTTVQKRIPKKANIVTDARTGELTLMHKLPFNWRHYLSDAER